MLSLCLLLIGCAQVLSIYEAYVEIKYTRVASNIVSKYRSKSMFDFIIDMLECYKVIYRWCLVHIRSISSLLLYAT